MVGTFPARYQGPIAENKYLLDINHIQEYAPKTIFKERETDTQGLLSTKEHFASPQ